VALRRSQGRAGRGAGHGNLVSNSGETLRRAALAGVGIWLAAGFLVHDDLESGELVRILPDYRPVEFAMNAVYPHRHHLSAKVRTFIDLLALRRATEVDQSVFLTRLPISSAVAKCC
jgi:DNA-binding transcriptional LysR family regulator